MIKIMYIVKLLSNLTQKQIDIFIAYEQNKANIVIYMAIFVYLFISTNM